MPAAKFQAPQSKSASAPADLPAGKAILIKASYSAGMKPLAIARMFRLSQSVVSRVLDLPAKSKKQSGVRCDWSRGPRRV